MFKLAFFILIYLFCHIRLFSCNFLLHPLRQPRGSPRPRDFLNLLSFFSYGVNYFIVEHHTGHEVLVRFGAQVLELLLDVRVYEKLLYM